MTSPTLFYTERVPAQFNRVLEEQERRSEHAEASEEERRLLEEALESSGGDRKDAARLLGVSARSLRYLIQKHRKNAPSRFVGNDNS